MQTRRRLGVLGILAGAALFASCTGGSNGSTTGVNRQWTDHYAITITPNEIPPRALDRIDYTIVVRDKQTGEPIEHGEGRIYANNREGAKTNDGLAASDGLGTYHARLLFVASGEWAVGLQFRRDSTMPLEKVDWMQDVLSSKDTTY
jgi:hypothetical protein